MLIRILLLCFALRWTAHAESPSQFPLVIKGITPSQFPLEIKGITFPFYVADERAPAAMVEALPFGLNSPARIAARTSVAMPIASERFSVRLPTPTSRG